MNIVITGASRGLGLELTTNYLEAGHHLCAMARTESEALKRLLADFPDALHFAAGDVSREEDVSRFREFAERHMSGVDILINNAAVNLEQAGKDIEEIDMSIYEPSFRINSMGPLIMVKHLLPLLRRGERKLIANISSEAGSIGDSTREKEFSYCMSKAALNMAMKILQNRLKREQIKVLLIHPGWVRTDMGGQAATLSTSESATAVVRNLLDRKWRVDEGIYFNWKGEEMSW